LKNCGSIFDFISAHRLHYGRIVYAIHTICHKVMVLSVSHYMML